MIIPADHIQIGLHVEILPASDKFACHVVNDARENGESPYQIIEGSSYQYVINDNNFRFEENTKVIVPFVRDKTKGSLHPNIYVGTLSLGILKGDDKVGEIEIEVQSKKSSYRKDYRFMLEEITEHCLDLILQLNTPVSQTLTFDHTADSKTWLQRFAFVSSIVNSTDFKDAIHRVLADPNSTWTSESEQVDFRRVRRIRKDTVRQLVSGSNRMGLSDDHPLKAYGFSSIPQRITDTRKVDSYDTAENRFIKHALESFSAFLSSFNEMISSETREYKESVAIQNQLNEYLGHSLFREVSRPVSLKLNSPILQRKSGYREILRSWILFDLAAKLIWKGGEDVYKAGKRDVATLYEYWIFFKLLELFSETFNIDKADLNQLIVSTKDGAGLQIKQGKHLALHGVFEGSSRRLKINFSYNRSFQSQSDYPNHGSWTVNMRPDYTLSIWPAEFDQDRAEELELITHVHFDAKYKIDNFLKLVDNEDADEERKEQALGKFKNVDILKMHAYKDAIRRTGGAYVLYPGEEPYQRSSFHEVMPGLGAFPLRPSKSDSGIVAIKAFVLSVVDHLIDRATQRERSSIQTHYIHRDKPDSKVQELIPEYSITGLIAHPNDIQVLVGFYRGEAHLNWIKSKGKYNARIGSDNGSIPIDREMASATYLLLHTEKDKSSGLMFKIKSRGGKLYTDAQLTKLSYPTTPSQPAYLVFDVELADPSDFGNSVWDFKKLKNYESRRGSAKPFTANLTELMGVKVKD